jgi:hypothetical protein
MKNLKPRQELKEEPLVEVIPYSRVKEKDILILRCKKGEEKDAILNMREELKAIIQQKDLRILAVSKDVNFSQLSIMVEATKEYKEKEDTTNENV